MTIKFSELQTKLKEAKQKTLVFSFGRMNPPTIGHEKLVNKIKSEAKARGADARLYLSHTSNKDKDPLTYNEKAKYAKKAFSIFKKSTARTIIEVAKEIEADGYTDIVMVFGEDRDAEMVNLIKRYNGKDFNFNSINNVSAGKRDPNAKGVEGISGTKLRELAKTGKIEEFKKALASGLSDRERTDIYKKIRKVYSLSDNIEFERVAMREAYLTGDIFNVGDIVFDMNENAEYEITEQGTNFVYVKDGEGNVYTKWLSDLSEKKQKDDEDRSSVRQDPDIKDKSGTQPAKYYSGLKSKSTKSARDAHFKKGAEKSDDDPSAYKPAPGDARAKTKPSKHTQKFKQMFGEVSPDTADAMARYKAGKAGFTDIAHLKAKGLIKRSDGTKRKSEKYEEVSEVLKVSDGLGAWIDDFMKSDAPQFQGKSDEKRKQMAIAAFVDAGGELSEEVIDEMPRWIIDLIGDKTKPRGYDKAEKILRQILDRKAKEAGGMKKLKHDIAYYAAIVARQINGIDARVLARRIEESTEEDWDDFLSEEDEALNIPEPDEVNDEELEKAIADLFSEYDEIEDVADVYPDKDGDGIPNDQDDEDGINVDAEEIPDDDEMLNADYQWVDIDEVLTPAQRLKRSQLMKRLSKRIQRKRMIALRRMSSPDKLKKRARRHARNKLRKRFTKGKPYSTLGMAQKQQIEKFIKSKKKVIDRLAIRLLPTMRKLEMKRLTAMKSRKEDYEPISQLIESNQYRVGSEMYYQTFNDWKESVDREALDSFDRELLESDIGSFAMYEGNHVPLDCPMIEEEKEPELNKPKAGGPKKYYVYVKDPKSGNIKKVSWGDTTGLKIKLNDPEARKSFAARHQCSTKKDKTKPGYWACRMPYYAKQLGLSGGGNFFW